MDQCNKANIGRNVGFNEPFKMVWHFTLYKHWSAMWFEVFSHKITLRYQNEKAKSVKSGLVRWGLSNKNGK